MNSSDGTLDYVFMGTFALMLVICVSFMVQQLLGMQSWRRHAKIMFLFFVKIFYGYGLKTRNPFTSSYFFLQGDALIYDTIYYKSI